MKPRFVADCNVGRLARWLRALGYDATYHHQIGDAELVRRALAERRVLLTRDRDLMQRRPISTGLVQALLLRDDRVREQLRQVVAELGLGRERCFSRCLECNLELLLAPPEAVRDRVPPYVAATQTAYAECRRCGRVYWAGTHQARMRGFLEASAGG